MPSSTTINPWVALTFLICWFYFTVQLQKRSGGTLKTLFHCVDISQVNAWLLYRRHCNQLQILQKKQMSLLTFIRKIAQSLGAANKVPRGVGRTSKRKSTDDVLAAKHKSSQPLPWNVILHAIMVCTTDQNTE